MAGSRSHLRHRQVDVEGVSMHVVEGGSADAGSILFLHGWPEDWSAFERVMLGLAHSAHVVAIDLPAIGSSRGRAAAHDKRTLARYVDGVAAALALREVTLVGHDVGAQIAYACLRTRPGRLARVVLMNGAVPGVDPWDQVVRNPHIWHFGFHAVPELPELLVAGHVAEYFAYFYEILAGPAGVGEDARRSYGQAYSSPSALRTGFDWYRAFPQDEKDNLAVKGQAVDVPVLYLRGELEPGDMDAYLRGFRDSGIERCTGAVIPRSGHFTPDEQPDALADTLRRFVNAS